VGSCGRCPRLADARRYPATAEIGLNDSALPLKLSLAHRAQRHGTMLLRPHNSPIAQIPKLDCGFCWLVTHRSAVGSG
jgi:hypothetical protein